MHSRWLKILKVLALTASQTVFCGSYNLTSENLANKYWEFECSQPLREVLGDIGLFLRSSFDPVENDKIKQKLRGVSEIGGVRGTALYLNAYLDKRIAPEFVDYIYAEVAREGIFSEEVSALTEELFFFVRTAINENDPRFLVDLVKSLLPVWELALVIEKAGKGGHLPSLAPIFYVTALFDGGEESRNILEQSRQDLRSIVVADLKTGQPAGLWSLYRDIDGEVDEELKDLLLSVKPSDRYLDFLKWVVIDSMRDEVVITREEFLNYLARKNFNLESSKLAIEVMFVTWARENTFAELSAQQNDFHELLRSYSRSGGRLRELYWRLGDIFPFGPINSIEKKVGLERLAFNLSGYSINPMDVNFNEKKRDLRFAESFLALIEASPVEAAAWNGFSHVILSNLAKSALFFERNSHSFEVGVHMRAVDHLENIVSQVQSLQEGVEPFLKSHAGILRLVQEKEGGLESRSAQLQYRELHLFRAFELEAEKSIKQEGRLGFQLYVFEKWRQHPLVNEYVSAYFINHPEDISDRELSIAVMQERPVGKNDLLFTLMQEEFLRRMPKLLGKFLERYPNYEHPAGGGI